MDQGITFGIDISKHVFQVHGVDGSGVVLKRRLRRGEVIGFFARYGRATIGMEACGTSHYWARELSALGHEVRLMPPAYVKPYVKRQKNDAADAEAICEAVTRPGMRFVAVKSADQQAATMVYRARQVLVVQETAVINSIRAHMAELGLIAAQGRVGVARLLDEIEDERMAMPALARLVLRELAEQLRTTRQRLAAFDRVVADRHRQSDLSRRLATIPGIGPLIAGTLIAEVPDPRLFASGRQFAAWLGLVPRQNSSGGKARLGRITKQGNANVRRLLIIGAQTALRWAGRTHPDAWSVAIRGRKPRLVAAVALANKTARIAWAIMARGGTYRRATFADVVAPVTS